METVGTYQSDKNKLPEVSACLYPYSSDQYEPPTSNQVRILLKQLNLTGAEAADIVGVHSRTVRKWTADESTANHRAIPYAAWRLLLISGRLEKQ